MMSLATELRALRGLDHTICRGPACPVVKRVSWPPLLLATHKSLSLASRKAILLPSGEIAPVSARTGAADLARRWMSSQSMETLFPNKGERSVKPGAAGL